MMAVVVRPLLDLPAYERRLDCDACGREVCAYTLQLAVIGHHISVCMPCLRRLHSVAWHERRTDPRSFFEVPGDD